MGGWNFSQSRKSVAVTLRAWLLHPLHLEKSSRHVNCQNYSAFYNLRASCLLRLARVQMNLCKLMLSHFWAAKICASAYTLRRTFGSPCQLVCAVKDVGDYRGRGWGGRYTLVCPRQWVSRVRRRGQEGGLRVEAALQFDSTRQPLHFLKSFSNSSWFFWIPLCFFFYLLLKS